MAIKLDQLTTAEAMSHPGVALTINTLSEMADTLRTQNQAMLEALKDARTVMLLHRDFLDKKNSATWQLAIDPMDAAIKLAEGEDV